MAWLVVAASFGGAAAATPTRLSTDYGRLPMQFEPATGASISSSFLSTGQGYQLTVSPAGVVVALRQPGSYASSISHRRECKPGEQMAAGVHAKRSERAILRMSLLNANPRAAGAGLEQLPGRANRLLGNDPSRWVTQIPLFAKVQYTGIYPGVDLVYYGNQRRLEFDFRLSPGASPDAIHFSFEGAKSVELDEQGDLVLRTASGQVRQHKPVIYQEMDGGLRTVEGSYVINARRQIGFSIGQYDRTKPLVIDPVLSYATYLGGTSVDQGWGVAVDANGNAYIAGETQSANYGNPPGGAYTGYSGSMADGGDAFVAKLNASGTALVYFTYLGGNSEDTALALELDAAGNAYVTGVTSSTNFPTVNAVQRTIGGAAGSDGTYPYDGFVAKLNPSGSALVYSTYVGGSDADESLDIAVDASGSAYITGHTGSPDFPVVHSIMPYAGVLDLFVAKLSSTGQSILYSTFIGGNDADSGEGIAVDTFGNAYVGGQTFSTDFPTLNPIQARFAGERDAFLLKLDAGGTKLLYSTYLGGEALDRVSRVVVDKDQNACLTGQTFSTNFPLVHPLQSVFGGKSDAFIAKVNSAGNALVFSTFLGGSGTDSGWDLALDAMGNIFVVGNTFSPNLPVVDPIQPQLLGDEDVFVAEYAPNGSALVYSTFIGGNDFDNAYGIAVDAGGTAYITGGTYSSTGFPVSTNTFQSTYGGGPDDGDGFVAKVLPTPRLNVAHVAQGVLISWPATQPPYRLQSTDNPATQSTWTTDNSVPVVNNGRNTITKPTGENRKFYRLVLTP